LSYTIIENFLPASVEYELEDMFQNHTKWNYSSLTSGSPTVEIDPLVKECPQLIHQSLWNQIGDPDSINLTTKVLYFLEFISGCNVKDIHKIKVNMNLLDQSFKGKYHPPHSDHKGNDYFSLIYYITNQMHTGTCPQETENRLVINYVFKAENLKLDFQKNNSTTVRYIA
jgi:hypothetical protein